MRQARRVRIWRTASPVPLPSFGRHGGTTLDDRTPVERVRAKLGRVVSHPYAIAVTADNCVVTLSGPILEAEVPRLLQTVEGVRGSVKSSIN
jgi:hypothetical protein